ncbi:hypothetical protein AOCH_001277 [Aspergillus ochraceoroseus]|uniref:Formamidopyrimidine-DNA glycosylase catalytic domain-containing protein n=1 Tax=Aspergillus ochraceoroseus TaxID=138278 RepID=A0A0F8VEJ2_9EURO|nr:hypothetical protein AOCH_001277 [Aspergillus ochraceoroseus]
MPELAEIYRVVHFIRLHLVGKTLTKVSTQHDDIVYGKVGTSAAEFQKAMQGKTIVGAGQQGKYFWITMSSPPHVVMHFGMAGWLKIRDADTYYYRTEKPEDKQWPPKYWKFLLETDGDPKTEAAFVDFRRLGRIRLVDCPAEEIRNHSPLKENGPDPVVDEDLVTEKWLGDKLKSRKKPIKALLLDQENISGIGNWMGDEILYHAKIHPEQYSNTLTGDQIKQLHSSIHYVCSTSVDLLADSDKFPEAGCSSTDGKKTGPVAGDVDEDESSGEREVKRKRTSRKKEDTAPKAKKEELKLKKTESKPQSKPPIKSEDKDEKIKTEGVPTRRRSTRLGK